MDDLQSLKSIKGPLKIDELFEVNFKPDNRIIRKIIIHCSASSNPKHDNIGVIRNWHMSERGWKDIGYHFVITSNGEIWPGRPIDQAGAHCEGHNFDSIGICLTGDKIFTQEQKVSAAKLSRIICEHNDMTMLDVLPHRAFNKGKTCPNFDINSLFNLWSD